MSPGGRPSRQPGDEVRPVLLVPEDGAPLQAPHDHGVEGAGRRSRAKSGTEGSGRRAEGIEARLAGHGDGERTTEIVRMQRPPFRLVETVVQGNRVRFSADVAEGELAASGFAERRHAPLGISSDPHGVPVPVRLTHQEGIEGPEAPGSIVVQEAQVRSTSRAHEILRWNK